MNAAGFINGLPVRRCPKHGEFPGYDGGTGYPIISCRECDSYSEDDRPGGFVASSTYSIAEAVAEWNNYVDGEISEEDEARAAGMVSGLEVADVKTRTGEPSRAGEAGASAPMSSALPAGGSVSRVAGMAELDRLANVAGEMARAEREGGGL